MNLDQALTMVAEASFYEDKRIVPLINVDTGEPEAYLVEDDHANTDDWEWSYDEGIHDRDSVSETSRLHDPYEHYSTAYHIRYNMPEAVERLEEGKSVAFAYAVVRDRDVLWDEDTQEYRDKDGDVADEYAGWILTADW